MVGMIEVGFQAVAVGASQLGGTSESLAMRVQDAASAVRGLLDSGWSGSSASAFGVGFQEWDDAATECISVLDQLVAGVRGTVSDFVASEQANFDVSTQLASGMASMDIAAIMGGQ